MMRKIPARFVAVVSFAALTAGLGACRSFHEWPEGDGVDPTLIRTTLLLHVDWTPVAEAAIQAAKSDDGRRLRYTIDLFAAGGGSQSGKVAGQVVFPDDAPDREAAIEVPFELHAGKYRVCVWADCVRQGDDGDLHYNTADLGAVTLNRPYAGSTDMKDAFSGFTEIDLTPYRDRYFADVDAEVELQRACGKFRIRTNDLALFRARLRTAITAQNTPAGRAEPGGRKAGNGIPGEVDEAVAVPVPATVRLVYPGYFPCGYDVNTGWATSGDFRTDVAFTGEVSELGPTSAVLAYDYVFVCTEATVVYADIEAYDTAGRLISRCTGIRIPVERGKLTTVEGAFLTQSYDNGDIGIDDRFEDEIVVTLPD